jgi:methionine-S-sulfoxide reductase
MSAMKKCLLAFIVLLCAVFIGTQSRSEGVITDGYKPSSTLLDKRPDGYPAAVFAGGCFWCIESEFRRIEGVLYTRSGYAGGTEKNPTYQQVSAHRTSHREAVEIVFDPEKVSYRNLVDFFMTRAHDPTQADGQGPDIGFQYTSAIFYMDEDQKEIADDLIAEYRAAKRFKNPIVTKVLPFSNFYEAEDYHQRYYEKYQEKTGSPHMNMWLKQQKENARSLFKAGE